MEANLRTQVRVSEPSPYGEGSPHSYFRDLVAAVSPVPVAGKADAEERLRRHGRDVQTRAAGGTAAARRAVRDLVRRDTPAEAEYRAMTTGTGSGLAFVTPAYLLDQWAKWRSYVPAVADACRNVELPEYGMEINVPAVLSGPDAVAIQATENSSVGETNLTAGYRTAAVETFAGSTTVSQQLFDRAGPASTT
jgi:HK97 family phage major capsid protein